MWQFQPTPFPWYIFFGNDGDLLYNPARLDQDFNNLAAYQPPIYPQTFGIIDEDGVVDYFYPGLTISPPIQEAQTIAQTTSQVTTEVTTQTSTQIYICNKCPTTFKRGTDLRRHYKKHFASQRAFPCNQPGCDRVGNRAFYRQDKLNDHRRQAHGL